MGALFEKIKNFFSDPDEYDEAEYEDEDFAEEVEEPKLKIHKFRRESKKGATEKKSSKNARTITYAPKTIEDAVEILEFFKQGKAVVFSIVDVSSDNKRRIVDFLSGAIKVLDGDIYKVTNGVFVADPIRGNVENYIDKVTANKESE